MTLKERVAAQDRQIAQLQLDNHHLLVKIEDAEEVLREVRDDHKDQILKIVELTRGDVRADLLSAGDDLARRLQAAQIHLSLVEY